ncbi:MAG: ThuA domain-containing protein [Caulobacterales bacterium]|nr:ThuA domain-containing protein [Caulobacterales bacterium]
MARPIRAVALTGGVFHAFEEGAAALAEDWADIGVSLEPTSDIDAAFERLAAGDAGLFVIYALRWRMMNAEKYEPYRAEWAYQSKPAHRRALTDHLARGGGLIALHTACICFDDWPEWPAILGGAWEWGRSHHPPPGPARIEIAGPPHAITPEPSAFELTDEVYADLSFTGSADVLATAQASPDGAPQPAIWAREHGAGRVVVDTLGHDAAALRDPHHAAILRRAALWAAGADASGAASGERA